MNCKECLSIVEEYVESSLDPQASSQAAVHIFDCDSCRTVYEELKNEKEVYSRYLLKIKEKPRSWEAVRKEINASEVAIANTGTAGVGFYERFSAFFRQPLIASMAALVLIIGIGFGLWYLSSARKHDTVSGAASARESASTQTKSDRILPAGPPAKNGDDKLVKNAPQGPEDNNGGTGHDTATTYSVRSGKKKKTNPVADPINDAISFDSSEAAFNKHIEKCEMVLRSFRNAVVDSDKPGFDISYERRLAKELLNDSVRFRREAENQGNLPIENLLIDLEGILGDMTKLRKNATPSDANSLKGRIQKSGIIGKLQIQSSIARASD